MLVLKFGGSSVGNPQRINQVIDILKGYLEEKKQIAVVFSAFQGVTDGLIATAKKAVDGYGLKDVEVFVKGPGVGRESAIRSINNVGLKVMLIKDITPVPHNGCRPKKRRRV